jgi:putative transposase
MDVLEDVATPLVSIAQACAALGVSRATLYRSTSPSRPPTGTPRPPSPRKLSESERQAILAVMHNSEFVDQPPTEVYAKLLSRGTYLASIRTMYRILATEDETQERRNQRLARVYVKPSYVIIDLYSRYVVGWMVATKECKGLATQLFAESIARHGIEPGLIVHSDRGSAMKSDTLAQLLVTLGVDQSFSRPHVSDDNPFSESQFRTMKYQPDYPGFFAGVLHARGWLESFFVWHNDEHQHSGLALFTPAEVFFGRVPAVHAVRQRTLDLAYAAHPNRFMSGPPSAALPPAEVHINPLEARTLTTGASNLDRAPSTGIDAAPRSARRPRDRPASDAGLARLGT